MLKKYLAVLVLLVSSVAAQGTPITDTVTVSGTDWAQVSLFGNLSWVQIITQCPAGICGATSVLNGWDMEAWTFAAQADVDVLFNTLEKA